MSTNTQGNNKRIAKNTIMLYIRMLVTMVVSLYTSRVVLDVLGVEDFGIYSVVGGIVVVLSFLNNSMATATQRFLNFELGKNNLEGVKKVFSTSIILHIVIAAIVFVLALTVGFYFLTNQMNISADRMVAARYVFIFSVLTFVFQTITVPYNSIIIAKEKMSAYAYLSIIEVVAKLLVVYLILVLNGDKLFVYALLQFLVSILIRFAYIIYSNRTFVEASFKNSYIDRPMFKEMFSFSSWSIVGNLGYILHTQGISIVTNIYFNAVVNAALGISNQINSAVTSFTSNFQVALNPQIVKSYAANELDVMHKMICRGCKFSFFLIAIFTVPILVETPQILDLWLTTVPADTVEFVRLILIVTMINSFSNILAVSQGATGKVKTYQIVLTTIGLLHLPFAMICFEWGYPAYSATIVYIALSLVLMAVRVLIVSKSVQLPIKDFIKDVCIPSVAVVGIGLFLSIIIHRLLPISFAGFILSCAFSLGIVVICIFFIGLNKSERFFLYNQIFKYIKI